MILSPCAAPVLVTVSTTGNGSPIPTDFGADTIAASTAPAFTVTTFDVRGPTASGLPVLASDPVTVAVNLSVPGAAGWYTQERLTDAPPARTGTGIGDVTRVATPSTASAGLPVTPMTAACPVLVTVRVTVTSPPWQAGDGDAVAALEASEAGHWEATGAVAAARIAVPAHVSPAAVTVKATGPAPVAEYVQTKVWAAPPASTTGPAGTGPALGLTSAAPGPAMIAGRTEVTSASPVFVTVSETSNHSLTETDTGAAIAAASKPGAWIAT